VFKTQLIPTRTRCCCRPAAAIGLRRRRREDLAALGGRHDRRRRRLALQDDVDEAVDGALLRLLDRARPEARVVGGVVVIDDRVFGDPDPRIAAEEGEGARRRAHQRSIAAIG